MRSPSGPAARAGSRPRWVVGRSLRLGIGRRTSRALAEPKAGRALPKLVSNKSLSECCAGPGGFWTVSEVPQLVPRFTTFLQIKNQMNFIIISVLDLIITSLFDILC